MLVVRKESSFKSLNIIKKTLIKSKKICIYIMKKEEHRITNG